MATIKIPHGVYTEDIEKVITEVCACGNCHTSEDHEEVSTRALTEEEAGHLLTGGVFSMHNAMPDFYS